jgi:hypothetical protein
MRVSEETKKHAQDILDFIAFNEEGVTHDQSVWWGRAGILNPPGGNVCGTTMCVAGTSTYLIEGIQGLHDSFNIEHCARVNLGLEQDESRFLFYETNNRLSLDCLRALASGDQQKFHEIMFTPV